MRGILSFSSPRCAIIARLNVIYTKFRRAMIAQLNKIWRVWACVILKNQLFFFLLAQRKKRLCF